MKEKEQERRQSIRNIPVFKQKTILTRKIPFQETIHKMDFLMREKRIQNNSYRFPPNSDKKISIVAVEEKVMNGVSNLLFYVPKEMFDSEEFERIRHSKEDEYVIITEKSSVISNTYGPEALNSFRENKCGVIYTSKTEPLIPLTISKELISRVKKRVKMVICKPEDFITLDREFKKRFRIKGFTTRVQNKKEVISFITSEVYAEALSIFGGLVESIIESIQETFRMQFAELNQEDCFPISVEYDITAYKNKCVIYLHGMGEYFKAKYNLPHNFIPAIEYVLDDISGVLYSNKLILEKKTGIELQIKEISRRVNLTSDLYELDLFELIDIECKLAMEFEEFYRKISSFRKKIVCRNECDVIENIENFRVKIKHLYVHYEVEIFETQRDLYATRFANREVCLGKDYTLYDVYISFLRTYQYHKDLNSRYRYGNFVYETNDGRKNKVVKLQWVDLRERLEETDFDDIISEEEGDEV